MVQDLTFNMFVLEVAKNVTQLVVDNCSLV